MELQGRYVRDMLEAGVAEYVKYEEGVDLPGSLLQTSGISHKFWGPFLQSFRHLSLKPYTTLYGF